MFLPAWVTCISTVCFGRHLRTSYHIDRVRHVSIGPSSKIAPQHQRGGLAVLSGIIIGTARQFAESCAAVKTERGVIVLIDFQKYSPCAKAGEAAQIEIEQFARKTPSALAAGNRNGEDFRLVLDQPRHD